MSIWCVECDQKVLPTLKSGETVYSHRADLFNKLFWKCETCNNFVGCHPGTQKALGCIANQALKNIRKTIHAELDPLWKSKKVTRKYTYNYLDSKLGYRYHTANIRTIIEAYHILNLIDQLKGEIQ